MDPSLRSSMRRYYDERASEYEDVYVLGTGSASIADPDVFRREIPLLADVVERCASGRIVDLACGTGYWLPRYAPRCSTIALIDQAPRMLAEARKKVAGLGIQERASVVEGDVLEHRFAPRSCDTALAGFLLSHLTDAQERILFAQLRGLLAEGGRFLILDSAWSPERARVNTKVERQERRLNNGARFEIYKRYLDRQDVVDWTAAHGVEIAIEHFGPAFVAVSGTFGGDSATASTGSP